MRSCVLASLFSLAVAYTPFERPGHPSPPHHVGPVGPYHHGSNATCISASDASLIATSFGLTISNYTEALAVQLFTSNFTDQSDSVNTLIHEPGLQASDLGSLTFSSKAEFLAGQGAQPPVPFVILNLWNTCNTVIIRWLSDQSPLPVQGISIATVEPAQAGEGGGFGTGAQKWQISAIVAEFNSGAWLGNLGYPECKPAANTTAS
ncbi:unnamed protein product [Aureobasidium pullulans]|uniref:NTF2-like domain-containing protein n=1 Tax=Aureobasidium pullulans TaxID=5580 RepID=A0A4S9TE69_AURPU|nr:hypothetical protein D6D23_07952 [Aureobasidium pullulans]THW64901.1 hypothetical protein D6D20_02569 [Aureobasidium pullulans]THW88602.1 hypothetical protein D6D15_05869 [Aureobasidium pullulans]THX86325.1 hypothetical protein D6D04_01443 [Aureobasidium pullulans]THY02864.1 hypothetical protein D6D03_04800 [Aureobasidium pullulans]